MLKKKYILFTAISLVAAALLAIFPQNGATGAKEAENLPARTTLLCVGLDAAAGNTDVLMLLSLDRTRKEISLLQIPRDTYFSSSTAQCKINQLYPSYRLLGQQPREALATLSSNLSEAFGVPIDGFAAMDISFVALLIDELGGVSVNVPTPIRHRASDGDGYIEIPAGEQLLFGREAIEFLRFRADYLEGDIGRLDAQKLLLGATYRKLKRDVNLPLLVRLLPKMYGNMMTDCSLGEVLSLARDYYAVKEQYSVRLLTLPGEATRRDETGGLSYYAANRKAADEVLLQFFGGNGFDKDRRFLYAGKPHFENIYYDENMAYTVVTEDALDGMDIKIKKK